MNQMTDQDTAEITPQIVAEHGLTTEEYSVVVKRLNRHPNLTELGIFSVMWSEHCSYKSSRFHLAKLPTTGPQVIQGPGENAGIIDIGDGDAAVFKMESHNHPSYIEPYQGAATGVGGIMRDVFTMGARPVANMNALRFGEPDHPKTQHLVSGVVAGIGGYGNCMGVPTIGGETNFHAGYNGNILVNAMTVGLVRSDNIFYSAPSGPGNPVVYVGSKTGRDGIHGATMASAEFDDATDEKRPTVQVGDPFTEKLLLEACLELMQKDAIDAIQDMGAAGLTSSSVEMADKGGVGITLNLDKVPQREENMTAYEMMLSESQERMLMVLKTGHEPEAKAIFDKWGLDFAVIGQTTETGHLILVHQGETVCDIPIRPLADDAPKYERPFVPTPPSTFITPEEVPAPNDIATALKTLIASPDLASRRWIYEQYDYTVMADTVQIPGGDAGVVRVHGTNKALAVSTDVTPRYCFADPVEGGKQAVAETYRNITAVGGKPLAITDCLNFGNPERPEIMGQFVGCLDGISQACLAFDTPVISGNVSLYNETNGIAIPPTPAIGGVGLLKDSSKMTTLGFKNEGDAILVVGGKPKGHLGQSIFLRELHGREEGTPPPVDLELEAKAGDFVRGLIETKTVNAVHDISDGGLLVAVAEMAMKGRIGATVEVSDTKTPLFALAFGEDQARYVLTMKPEDVTAVTKAAIDAGLTVSANGTVGGSSLTLGGCAPISLEELANLNEGWLPNFMSS
jgi:phosphoribosylformylglycinamidine synthase subunit PurL